VTLREDMESRRFIEYERRLNRMEAWTRGHCDTDSDRITAVVDEIDGLRKELEEIREWKERAAKFLNQLAEERKNGGTK
jgi:uncharacterized protein HemX